MSVELKEPSEDAMLTAFSCLPFWDTIRVEEVDGKFVVKWSCDTLGFHEEECDSEYEALVFAVKKRAMCLKHGSRGVHYGKLHVQNRMSE